MRGDVIYDQPYYVTRHACDRYRERVRRVRGGDRRIIREINEALQGRAPYPPDRDIAIGVPRRFVAIVAPPLPEYDMPAVMTVWRWGCCPIMLKRRGGPINGWRFYRWLNRPYQGYNEART